MFDIIRKEILQTVLNKDWLHFAILSCTVFMYDGHTNTNGCKASKADLQIPLSPIHPLCSDRIFDLRCQPATAFPPSCSLSLSLSLSPLYSSIPPPVSDVTIILKKRRRGVGRPAAEPTRERTGEEWSGSCRRRRSKMLQGALVNVFMSHISNGMIQWFAEPESNLPLTCFTQLCKFMIMINHGSLRKPWPTMSESCV